MMPAANPINASISRRGADLEKQNGQCAYCREQIGPHRGNQRLGHRAGRQRAMRASRLLTFHGLSEGIARTASTRNDRPHHVWPFGRGNQRGCSACAGPETRDRQPCQDWMARCPVNRREK